MTLHLNKRQLAAARTLVGNSQWTGQLSGLLGQSVNFKHDLGFDFGYPKTSELRFDHFYEMYKRNGIARSLVKRTAIKTWQEHPAILEQEESDGKETKLERDIRNHLSSIRFWQLLQECDKRSLVGKYAGLIFQLGDGLAYDQPVAKVPGGIEGIISVLPAWEGQLQPSQWDTDPFSPDYGKPTMFTFNESSVDPESGKVRSFSVHSDRCLVWSEDGTTFGDSALEPCYNALVDLEKLRGAGGEGFWKNAKSQPVLMAESDVDFNQLATMLGTDLEGLPDALDEVMAKWSKGFDESLILQGMQVKSLPVTLPQPEEFALVALQEVAASWPIPQKVLVGMQTGERASTEDAREWSQTCMSRRQNIVVPNIMDIIGRFELWGVLPERDWFVDWSDLTAPTLEEKLVISEKMAKVNQAMFATGDVVFTDAEIREVAGYETVADPVLTEPIELDDELEDDDA